MYKMMLVCVVEMKNCVLMTLKVTLFTAGRRNCIKTIDLKRLPAAGNIS